jgi:hypothetical protein
MTIRNNCGFSNRGGVVENRHEVHASVVDVDRKTLILLRDIYLSKESKQQSRESQLELASQDTE